MSARRPLSRRHLLAGAAATGAALLGAPESAVASPAVPPQRTGKNAAARPNDVPAGLDSISSAPEPGVSYRFAMWSDMTPLNSLANGRLFETQGVTPTSADVIGCTFDLPPGAVVHDIEWYGNTTISTTIQASVWSSGIANLATAIATASVAPQTAGMHAVTFTVPAGSNGPYPHGCKLVVFTDADAGADVQVNGVRVGLKNAPLSPVLLAKPVTVYNSTTTTPIQAKQTRTIPLTAHVPVGANAVLCTLSVQHTHGTGSLDVGPAGGSLSTIAASWGQTGDRAASTFTTLLSAGRAIAVRSAAGSGATDFTVDLVGYLL